MKKLHAIFALLFISLAVILPSCSKDDEPGGDSGNAADVVGTWRGDDYDHFYSGVSITFNSDGTGWAKLEHEGKYISMYRAEFTYKVKGKTVTTNGTLVSANSDGETNIQDFNNKYEVDGNQLIVKSGNGWYTGVVRTYRK